MATGLRTWRVSIRSGHGVGKSALDAWTILWFMSTHHPVKVGCTAPSSGQMKDVLWSELSKWLRRMPEGMRDQYGIRTSDQDLRVYLVGSPHESYATGRTGRKENPEALQGLHSENMLVIVDEASGVDPIVFEVAEGTLTSDNARILMTSNPTRTSGYFFDSHHSMRHRWHTMRVACSDSSQVSPKYIADMAEKYGRDSNVFRIRVDGEFPNADDDTLLPLDLIEAAVGRDVAPSRLFAPVWGLDVARFGSDRTALAKRQGNHLMEPVKHWSKRDLMETTGLVLQEYENTHADQRPEEIFVDSIGLGSGVVDRLRELNLPVLGVNVGESASSANFMRLRDELWWKAREWFERREGLLADDPELVSELSTVTFKVSSAGRIQVESKDSMRSRGLRSPDLADAFVLTFKGGTRLRPVEYREERYSLARARRQRWRYASAWAR